jgi:hypothetical protein
MERFAAENRVNPNALKVGAIGWLPLFPRAPLPPPHAAWFLCGTGLACWVCVQTIAKSYMVFLRGCLRNSCTPQQVREDLLQLRTLLRWWFCPTLSQHAPPPPPPLLPHVVSCSRVPQRAK